MKDRRTVLAGLAAGAAAAAVPGLALGGEPAPQTATELETLSCGVSPEHFPNVVVQTQEGRRARFYDDLIRGRTVMIHVTSVAGDAAYPVLANLAKVQPLLGDRLGREIFLYSIAGDPERDTLRDLKALAVRHGAAPPGWLFLTGEPADIALLRARLFIHDAGHDHAGGAPVEDCSRGLVRYGNAAVGLWGSVPATADPQWIVNRLSWVQARQPAGGPPRRRGPLPLTEQPWWPRREERS